MSKNPRKVVDAFLPGQTSIGDIVFRPITAATILLLEKIDCPLVDDEVIAAARKNKGKFDLKFSNDDIARLVFILTHSAKESLALINGGMAAFDVEVYNFLDRIPASDIPALGNVINTHFETAFSTIIGVNPSAGKKNVAEPPTPRTPWTSSSEMTTASAGP